METTKKTDLEKAKDVQKISIAIAEAMAEIKPENQEELEVVLAAGVANYLGSWMKFQKFEQEDIEMSLWGIGRAIAQCSDFSIEFWD